MEKLCSLEGSCQFGYKASVAENNSAVAIIIINHSGTCWNGGGDSGVVAVNIPVVMISATDGQITLVKWLMVL